MHSDAQTVEAYLAGLEPERRETVSKVRELILKHIPEGYAEVMNWGMITYEVPLEVFPDTYNKKPLMFAALASQKNYCSLYLMGIYCNPDAEERLKADFSEAGKKLKMGKSCIRFKTLEDLPLNVIAEAVSKPDVDKFVANYKQQRGISND